MTLFSLNSHSNAVTCTLVFSWQSRVAVSPTVALTGLWQINSMFPVTRHKTKTLCGHVKHKQGPQIFEEHLFVV